MTATRNSTPIANSVEVVLLSASRSSTPATSPDVEVSLLFKDYVDGSTLALAQLVASRSSSYKASRADDDTQSKRVSKR